MNRNYFKILFDKYNEKIYINLSIDILDLRKSSLVHLQYYLFFSHFRRIDSRNIEYKWMIALTLYWNYVRT